jgi:small acid-soluble spore protein H (minor)
MDNQRAKEIIASPTMMDVTYNSNKVYMESLNESSCVIHFLDQPVTTLNVPLSSLKENGVL